MTLPSLRFTTVALTGIVAGVLICSSKSSANIVSASVGPFSLHYKVNQVPDFDQKRLQGNGMPGFPNQGNMYCAPTAAADAAAYVGYHGYPDLMPVLAQPWEDWKTYGDAQYIVSHIGIEIFASAMECHPVNGTGGTGFKNGVEAYFPSDLFTVQWVFSSPQAPISRGTLGIAGVTGPHHALVLPTVGWYSEGSGSTMTRNGGHVLMLTDSTITTDEQSICWRDPAASGDSLFAQSQFASQCYELAAEQMKTVGGKQVILTKVLGYGTGWLDGYMRIAPKYGLVTKPDKLTLKYVVPISWEFAGNDEVEEVVPASSAMIDMAQSAMNDDLYYVTKAPGLPGKISKYSPGQKKNEDLPVAVSDPIKVTTGKRGEIYVLDGPKLIRCINPATNPPTVTSFGPTFNLADIAYDDFNDRLVGLARSRSRCGFGRTAISEEHVRRRLHLFLWMCR